MVEIIPCVGMCPTIEEIIQAIRRAGDVEWVHIDIADNTLVPQTSCLDFSLLARSTPLPMLEAHLMVATPEKYIKGLADAGFKRLIAHVEAHDPRLFLDQVKYEHVEAGIAIDAPTGFEEVEPFLEEIDGVWVLTAEAGDEEGIFQPECIEKVKSIHSYLPDLPIAVEGGLTPQSAKLAVEAGATRLLVRSGEDFDSMRGADTRDSGVNK